MVTAFWLANGGCGRRENKANETRDNKTRATLMQQGPSIEYSLLVPGTVCRSLDTVNVFVQRT